MMPMSLYLWFFIFAFHKFPKSLGNEQGLHLETPKIIIFSIKSRDIILRIVEKRCAEGDGAAIFTVVVEARLKRYF